MKTLSSLDLTLYAGKRALVRIDANVPIGTDSILDPYEAFRIDIVIPTLRLLQKNNISITLLAHHGGLDDTQSLAPVADYLKNNWGFDCAFIPGPITTSLSITNTPLTLLDNLRLNPGEKSNDPDFGKLLASYGDFYINEAFSASHRKHASIVGIPKHLPSYMGLHHEKEITTLEKLRTTREGLGVIVGGSKFETKIDLIRQFLNQGVPVFLGGALAHAIYHARGYALGKSFIDTTCSVDDIAQHPLLFVPEYVLVQTGSGELGEYALSDLFTLSESDPDFSIVDMGEQSRGEINLFLSTKKILLWNGPLGWYEKGYTMGTRICGDVIKKYPNLVSILGGGDTLTLLNHENMLGIFSFVSTGGGALLDYLLQGTSPGLEALG